MKPILVHAHIYYPHLWDELKACILNIYPYSFELFVTFVEAHPKIEADIRAAFPTAQILRVPNRGYDIGPFIEVLNRVNLADYSYVVKLHTKRDAPHSTSLFRHLTGGKWRNALLSFIRTIDSFKAYVMAFEANPQLGMSASYQLIVRNDIWNDKRIKMQLWQFSAKKNLPQIPYSYVGGSMFIARADVFRGLQACNLSAADFVETSGHETQFAHIVERLFGYFVAKQNLTVEDPVGDPTGCLGRKILFREQFIRPVVRFFYQRKVTEAGKVMIKFLKIPVYHGKVRNRGVVCK